MSTFRKCGLNRALGEKEGTFLYEKNGHVFHSDGTNLCRFRCIKKTKCDKTIEYKNGEVVEKGVHWDQPDHNVIQRKLMIKEMRKIGVTELQRSDRDIYDSVCAR